MKIENNYFVTSSRNLENCFDPFFRIYKIDNSKIFIFFKPVSVLIILYKNEVLKEKIRESIVFNLDFYNWNEYCRSCPILIKKVKDFIVSYSEEKNIKANKIKKLLKKSLKEDDKSEISLLEIKCKIKFENISTINEEIRLFKEKKVY